MREGRKVVVLSPRARRLGVAASAQARRRRRAARRREVPQRAPRMRAALAEAGAAAAAAGARGARRGAGLAPGAAAAAAALAGAVTSGLVRAVAEALAECLAASAQGGGFVDSPDAAVTCVSLAVALDAATAGSPLAAEALLLENLAAPLVPHLVAGLGLVGDPAAAEAATPGAGGGVPPPTAALEPLLAVVTRVVNGPRAFRGIVSETIQSNRARRARRKRRNGSGGVSLFALFPPCARYARSRDDFAQLLVASGAVDALASLFALCDRPKEQSVEPVPPAIVAGLRLLESLLTSAPPPASGAASTPAPSVSSRRRTRQPKETVRVRHEQKRLAKRRPRLVDRRASRHRARGFAVAAHLRVAADGERDARAGVGGPARLGGAFARELRLRRDGGDAAAQRDPRRVRVRGGAASPELLGPESRDAPLTVRVARRRCGPSGTEPPPPRARRARSAPGRASSASSASSVETADADLIRILIRLSSLGGPWTRWPSFWTRRYCSSARSRFCAPRTRTCSAGGTPRRWRRGCRICPSRTTRRRGKSRALPDARRRRVPPPHEPSGDRAGPEFGHSAGVRRGGDGTGEDGESVAGRTRRFRRGGRRRIARSEKKKTRDRA